MLYRVDWHMPNNIHRDDIFSRFLESGENPVYQLPDGLVMIGRWHDVGGLRGTSIWETNDIELLVQWMQHWNDKLQVDITPCVDDETAARIVRNALHLT